MIVILWLVCANLWVSSADPTVTSTNNQSGAPSTESTDRPKPEEGQSGLTTGHMAGIVIGGIALVVVAVAGIVFYKKGRRRRSIPKVMTFPKTLDVTAHARSGEK